MLWVCLLLALVLTVVFVTSYWYIKIGRQSTAGKIRPLVKVKENLQSLVAEKMCEVETVMDVFEQEAEVMARSNGDLFPIVAISAPILRLALNNVESKEADFVREQFQKVHDCLEEMSEEIQQINEEIKECGVDAAYFSVEENISNQFRKYMSILNAKPKFKEVKKKLFLEHFEKSGGDKNLHTLYSAVTGDNFDGESVLEITMNYEEKNRRVMEDFCVHMKKLFCVGLIALVGHAALTESGDEEKLLEEWSDKMQKVQSEMDAVIEDCIVSFPKLAEQDSLRVVEDQPDLSCEELAQAILDKLWRRYDWVSWSVRVLRSPKSFLPVKKSSFHCSTGKSCFEVPCSDEKIHVVVSYSLSPEPMKSDQILQLIQGQKKRSVEAIAELLFTQLPGDCVVHTIKTKELACCSSFSEEMHYWEEHDKVYVCVHSA